jgi:excisionase family DNA binding protein
MQNTTPVIAAYPMTTSFVARRLHVSEGYVRKLARDGRLPSSLLANGTRIFQPAEVDKLERDRAAR